MKPGPISDTNFQPIPLGANWDNVKGFNADNPFSFQEFTVPQPMPQQEVAPPAHVWEKIANVLDEQERMKAQAQASYAKANKKIKNNKKYILYAAIIMLFVAIILSII
jgi:hypothetical protein